MIAIDLSKHKALQADTKAMQQMDFTGNLNCGENVNDNTIISFVTKEAKDIILDFSQGTVKVL